MSLNPAIFYTGRVWSRDAWRWIDCHFCHWVQTPERSLYVSHFTKTWYWEEGPFPPPLILTSYSSANYLKCCDCVRQHFLRYYSIDTSALRLISKRQRIKETQIRQPVSIFLLWTWRVIALACFPDKDEFVRRCGRFRHRESMLLLLLMTNGTLKGFMHLDSGVHFKSQWKGTNLQDLQDPKDWRRILSAKLS